MLTHWLDMVTVLLTLFAVLAWVVGIDLIAILYGVMAAFMLGMSYW